MTPLSRSAGTPKPGGTAAHTPLRVDPYIIALLATVAFAALCPARGGVASLVAGAADCAVALIFFLYGSRLSAGEALAGLRHWRLHLTVLTSTFVLFPLLGLTLRALVPSVIAPNLYTGLLFLCLLPSTVQSSIVFTSTARGNVPAAVCAGTYSSLLGMFVSPLLASVLIGGHTPFSASQLTGIGGQILLPFLVGQFARRWIGPAVSRHKTVLGRVDRGSVLLVVYTAFSEGIVRGIWHQVSPSRLFALCMVEAVLLALVLTTTSVAAHALRFCREDRIAIVFAGSKKSLVNGLPIAAVLFGPGAGLIVLPLMLFHQMQLMVCAVIAQRWSWSP
ncbi:bile acid:sodium symporter family protein [Streptomyces sp. 8L]|uniref:bile acid:sodium symporter family protein n=1 Tax=Streptomyces sp. 8L TaxID=2877242 RepID=UPI001CD6F957|nr:bile acid:sodium symporter family protein [Streptomyces sp. 8L]MCA1219855.1 bile acid:sodium symporter [Streptomyces sp. 8L]